jgi:hypothetical protein
MSDFRQRPDADGPGIPPRDPPADPTTSNAPVGDTPPERDIPREPSPRRAPATLEEPGGLLTRTVLYPRIYPWYVFLAALDIMLTWVVLHSGGREVNVMADWVIRMGGLRGTVLFKFATVLLVIAICEVVGRKRPPLGLKIAEWSVAVTAIPVTVTLVQLLVVVLRNGGII